MVRIKVYKASQVAAVAAAVLLGLVVLVMAVSFMIRKEGQKGAYPVSSMVQAADGVTAAFSVYSPIMPSFTEGPVFENEHTDEAAEEIIVEVIRESGIRQAARPRVLIYHTHTHEAYAQVEDDPYEETEAWRTADPEHSVVRVGEALTELLTAQGFDVTHDTTDHEPPQLSTAYTRSLQTLEGYAGEEFDLYIDLHRDAYNLTLAECAHVNGQEAAQLMVLIGNGGNYEVRPDYEANLQFAYLLTDRLNQESAGICREVMVKNGRYNQHVGTPAILIEVGHNENTLSQALASMPPLADALAEILMSDQ